VIRSVCTLLMAVSWVLLAPSMALAGPDGGVDNQDLFGVQSGPAEDPADPPPTQVPEEQAPARRGLDPSGASPNVQVRTGLSPNEVKREPTPEELAAQAAQERAYQQELERTTLTNAILLFVGVVLFVLVLGGMAYAVFAMVFSKKGDDGASKADDPDAYAHLVQREATPAPASPAPTGADAPPDTGPPAAGSSPQAAEYLSGQPTPAPSPARQAASATPASQPGRFRRVDTPASVVSRAPRVAGPPADGPILERTATPAPLLRPSKPHAPTPPGYVPPRRPEPSTPRPPSPAPSAVAGEVDGTFVSYGNPVPLFKPERSETPAPRRLDGPDRPAPTPTPSSTPEGLGPYGSPRPEPMATPVPSFAATDSHQDDTPAPDGSRDHAADAHTVTDFSAADWDEDDPTDVHDTTDARSPAGTPTPVRTKRSATPPRMPWRKG